MQICRFCGLVLAFVGILSLQLFAQICRFCGLVLAFVGILSLQLFVLFL